MAHYAIAFDLDTVAMRNAGLTRSARTRIYQTEIPNALAGCGFTCHPQGSLYHTNTDQDPILALLRLQTALTTGAPGFCQYVRRVHVFRMEEWSDITAVIRNQPAAGVPTGEEELEAQEDMDGAPDEIAAGNQA